MAEIIFTGEVTGYGSYDNDPPGFDIAYPDARHPQTRTGNCWGTAYGDGSYAYPLAMAGDINRHPAGTVAYDEPSKRYYQLVDYCQACQAPANPRLDLYVGGDLNPTTAKVNTVNQAASNLTRIPGSTQVGRRLILNPVSSYPVPVLGPVSGISSGCGNVGPAQGGDPPSPPSPPPTGETTVNYQVDVYSQSENGGTDTSSGAVAGGVGTFDDPITAAAGPGGPAQGVRLYIDAFDKYFIVEDTSDTQPLLLWIGNADATQTANIRAAVRGTQPVIVNPVSGKPTNTQSFITIYSGGTPPVCAGTVRTVKAFGYSWVSNGGSGIAYPGGAPRHQTAQGNGSYTNPVTIAVENALLATYPKGSRLYIDKVVRANGSVSQVDKYGVVEDSASAGSGIGIWVGGAQNNGQRNTNTTDDQLRAAEVWVTGTATVIANPNLANNCPVPNQAQIALDPNVV